MTGLIPLVIVIFLVNVQVSSILPKKFKNEDDSNRVEELLTLEESDGITTYYVENIRATIAALNGKGRMETIDRDFRFPLTYQDVMACSGNTCKLCLYGDMADDFRYATGMGPPVYPCPAPTGDLHLACLAITYQQNTNEISACLTFAGLRLFCKTFPVKEWNFCMNIFGVEACGGLRGVRISDGKVCVDLKVSVAGINVNLPSICIPL